MTKAILNKESYRLLLFFVGVIATFSYRIIIVLNNYSATWVKIAWYTGTIGFIWYFAHRYKVDSKRAIIIRERNLIDKIVNKEELHKLDRESLLYILQGLESSKAKWNFIIIFVFSILALIYGVFTDLMSLFV